MSRRWREGDGYSAKTNVFTATDYAILGVYFAGLTLLGLEFYRRSSFG